MSDEKEEKKTLQFTARVHRQHSSLVVTVPKGLCRQLEIVKSDILLFEVETGDAAAVVGKLKLRGSESGENCTHTGRKD